MNEHHQADFSAVPPSNARGGAEDPWNHTKNASAHPELYNSAHGTVDTADEGWEQQQQQQQQQQMKDRHHTKNKQHAHPDNEEEASPGVFGHTVESKRSPQAFVKRDLDNV
ncbi:hypothetical protein BDB00DRAFT_783203 [Zychaea mexicana]|uniref:uncharacterized protein n=1 Tax=Zychaea mexicana TaxID=64656 RepID=UPI0022FF0D2E|nr:uncharacterized protein BDB00DRAFT_783203 [Zychaea mexicana]KAI9499735.1 hypothetical protein BDB00DRAFT_783203 [Zychaea mexicana]